MLLRGCRGEGASPKPGVGTLISASMVTGSSLSLVVVKLIESISHRQVRVSLDEPRSTLA